MHCPTCGAEITDPLAAFCPRCAAPLGAEEAEATTKLEVPAPRDSPTSTLAEVPVVDKAPTEHREGPALQKLAEARDRLDQGGWLDVIAAAGLGFLVLLVVGGVLALAAKLNFPDLGGGADPLSAFNAVVIAGLGSLGVPVVIDGLVVYALPLGAALVIGLGIMWAVRTASRDSSFSTVLGAVTQGAKVGIPFGFLCWFFALVFRVRGQHPVASDAGAALLAGAFWGALFGALGSIRIMETLRAAVGRVTSGLRARDRTAFEGATAGGVMLVALAVGAAGATLLWIIVALAKGAPGKHFGAGDAFAYVIYVVAFLPNIVGAIAAFSFGAPLDVGAKVDLGGKLVGPTREYSLASWGTGDPAWYLWLLVLLPIVACVAGGFVARRRATDPKSMLPVLLIASSVLAVTVTLLAAIGPLRLAGVTKGSGYAAVAPDVVVLFVFSFLASGVLGFLGWKLAETSNVMSDRFPQAR